MLGLKALADRYREAVADPAADAEARQAMLDNPKMNVSTFYNWLTTRGLAIVNPDTLSGPNKNAPKPVSLRGELESLAEKYDSISKGAPKGILAGKEADSVSSQPTGVLAETKFKCETRFYESAAQPEKDILGPTRFRSVIIEEGLGNMVDRFYYTKGALKSMAPLLEGKKIFADHPSRTEDVDRPERSVRDVVGNYENIEYMESEDGRGRLEADTLVLPDEPYRWARALMRHSVEYAKKHPDKSFVGLSINAAGDSTDQSIESFMEQYSIPDSAQPKLQEAREKGLETVRVVSEITDAVSVDLVTEAGAGGKILEILESEKGNMEPQDKKDDEEKKEQDGDATKADDSEKKEQDDAADDAGVIKAMVQKYLGDDDAEKEEVCAMGKETYEAYKEMGMDDEKASEAAGNSMKLAKYMAGKKKEADDAGEEEEPNKEQDEPMESKKDVNGKIKLLEAQNTKQKGEIASLTERLNVKDVAEKTEKLCKESKLPRSVTKVFKESVKDAKTSKEVEDKWSLFLEGYKANQSGSDDSDLMIESEKTGEEGGSGAIDLSDCTN